MFFSKLNKKMEFVFLKNGGNWPSTTGNPSGGGRGNGPRK